MSVRIKISALLQRFVNNRDTVEVQGKTVAGCLEDLVRQYPETGQWLYDRNGILMVVLLRNGEPVYQKDLKRRVKDGDVLTLTMIVGGG